MIFVIGPPFGGNGPRLSRPPTWSLSSNQSFRGAGLLEEIELPFITLGSIPIAIRYGNFAVLFCQYLATSAFAITAETVDDRSASRLAIPTDLAVKMLAVPAGVAETLAFEVVTIGVVWRRDRYGQMNL